MDWVGLILALLFFVAGIAGTVLPVLPGAPLILIGIIVYGLFAGFEGMSWWFFLLQAVAVGLTFLIDYAANVWGVRRFGGGTAAVWGSIIGLLLGLILLGPLGIIIGPFIGAVLGELFRQQPLQKAIRAGFGSLVGLVGGTALKLMVELGMVIWFLFVIF